MLRIESDLGRPIIYSRVHYWGWFSSHFAHAAGPQDGLQTSLYSECEAKPLTWFLLQKGHAAGAPNRGAHARQEWMSSECEGGASFEHLLLSYLARWWSSVPKTCVHRKKRILSSELHAEMFYGQPFCTDNEPLQWAQRFKSFTESRKAICRILGIS